MCEINWLSFLIASFATYRIARMIAWEEGPFECFTRLRSLAARLNKPQQDHWIYKGVCCPLCLGFWIGIGIGVWWFHSVVIGVGIAGAATMLVQQEK